MDWRVDGWMDWRRDGWTRGKMGELEERLVDWRIDG